MKIRQLHTGKPSSVKSTFLRQIKAVGSLAQRAPMLRTASMLGILTLICLSVNGQTTSQEVTDKKANKIKINIVVDENTATAILEDSLEAREFASLLPITAAFEDYAAREKFTYLPRKLSAGNKRTNGETAAWDLTYYVPLGSVAFFYKDYKPMEGLVKIGRVVSGNQFLTQKDAFKARIELAEK